MDRERAIKILFDTFWGPKGWKRPSDRHTPEKDLEFARAQGVMFPRQLLAHDTFCDAVRKHVRNVSLKSIANAFVAGIGRKRLEWISALGSYSCGRHLPRHTFETSSFSCDICGDRTHYLDYDVSVFNFERYKWGGVGHELPAFIAFDLDQFAKLDVPSPRDEDLATLGNVLDIARNCPHDHGPSDLEKALYSVLRWSADQRQTLLMCLGYCGILKPREFDSPFDRFTSAREKKTRSGRVRYWQFPVCWWKGSDGVNEDRVRLLFPGLES